MIARGLFTLPGFDEKFVGTIITQATPHQFPGKNYYYHIKTLEHYGLLLS